ncbi:MAG: hypothetical protein KAG92_04410 [Deltaproteobacteria bacterium]|nr:hypothetical protein [Deltaproteobacteria bacterium]
MSLPENSTFLQLPTNIATGRQLIKSETENFNAPAPKIFSKSNNAGSIYTQETIGDQTYGVTPNVVDNEIPPGDVSGGSGVTILPIEGAGRGPILANLSELTTQILLYKLQNAIEETEFTQIFRDRLDFMNSTLGNHENRIVYLENTAADHASTISENSAQIEINKTHWIQNEQAIAVLQPIVAQNETHLQNILPIVALNTNRIDVIEPITNSHSSQINSINATVSALNTEINDVDAALMLLADTVNDSSSSVDTLELDVAANQGLLQAHSENLNTINAMLGTANGIGSNNQYGYVGDAETILIGTLWPVDPPKIRLQYSQGMTVFLPSVVPQEMVYGHEGLFPTANDDEYEFTVNAALLEAATHTVITLDWDPGFIDTTDPLGTEVPTALSPVTTTTNDCMGLRIKGIIGLENTVEAGVGGTMLAQVAIDTPSGDDPIWITIAKLEQMFNDVDTGWVEKPFDIQLAYPQDEHTYQFRGLVFTTYAPVSTRKLTGAIFIGKVTESGSGAILSNDLQIEWSAEV